MGFSRRKIPHSSAYTISEKAIRFRHPDYNPGRAQKLISSFMSRLSTRNISSKSIHAFLSNLANRQTDRQTRANAFTSSFVGGNKVTKLQTHRRPKNNSLTAIAIIKRNKRRMTERMLSPVYIALYRGRTYRRQYNIRVTYSMSRSERHYYNLTFINMDKK